MRKRKPAEAAAIKARIVASLECGPKTSEEISAEIGLPGSSLGAYFSILNRSGEVSRYEYAKDKFRYYAANAAPAGSYRDHRKAVKPKPSTVADRMAFPVKQTRIWVGDRFNAITIPAYPWEVAA